MNKKYKNLILLIMLVISSVIYGQVKATPIYVSELITMILPLPIFDDQAIT